MEDSFDLSALYQDVRDRAARGERALVKLSPETLRTLTKLLPETATRLMALFVLAHATHPVRDLEAALLALPASALSSEEAIWLLNCYRKHIIQGRFKDGDRLAHDFLELLRQWLYHRDPRVQEWVLRTIDECGGQGIVFRRDVAKIKPGLWRAFRAHNRTLIELATYLERKWGAP